MKLGKRTVDAAETAMNELVDFNEIYGKGKGENKETGKKTRRAGGRKKSETATPIIPEKTDSKEEKTPE